MAPPLDHALARPSLQLLPSNRLAVPVVRSANENEPGDLSAGAERAGRLDELSNALVPQHPRWEDHGGNAAGLGRRAKRGAIDSSASDQYRCTLADEPHADEIGAVVRVLKNCATARVAQCHAPQPPQQRPERPRGAMIRREDV